MHVSANPFFFLTFRLIILSLGLVLAPSFASAVESRFAILEKTFQCSPSVRFTMPTLRSHAESARDQHKSNFHSPRADRSAFPMVFQSPIYGCNEQISCMQWPISHDILRNVAPSPYRLIMSDIMTPLGVVLAIPTVVPIRRYTNIQIPNNIHERYIECRTLPPDEVSQDLVDFMIR